MFALTTLPPLLTQTSPADRMLGEVRIEPEETVEVPLEMTTAMEVPFRVEF
jgi:hypothetical protein